MTHMEGVTAILRHYDLRQYDLMLLLFLFPYSGNLVHYPSPCMFYPADWRATVPGHDPSSNRINEITQPSNSDHVILNFARIISPRIRRLKHQSYNYTFCMFCLSLLLCLTTELTVEPRHCFCSGKSFTILCKQVWLHGRLPVLHVLPLEFGNTHCKLSGIRTS